MGVCVCVGGCVCVCVCVGGGVGVNKVNRWDWELNNNDSCAYNYIGSYRLLWLPVHYIHGVNSIVYNDAERADT